MPTWERRRGGRAARIQLDEAAADVQAVQLRRTIPTYELLDEANLDRLEVHSDWILAEIGVDIRGDDEALELFRSAGARVDGERVRFDPGLAAALCASTVRRTEESDEVATDRNAAAAAAHSPSRRCSLARPASRQGNILAPLPPLLPPPPRRL